MAVGMVRKSEQRAEQFARRYIQNNMNGAKTVRELYNPKSEKVAGVIAAEVLAKPRVILAVREQLEEHGLTDEVLDRELGYIVKQKRQLSPKLGAIVEANKLKGRSNIDNLTQHLHLHGITTDNIDSKLIDIQAELAELTGGDTPVSL